mmetsp:Transcript_95432/g.132574  ORF Transcript_95432/g.132574 Transcript_95432/m.132574 type:complete len:83 (-) Transcript_95432:346-594(-)
MASEPSPAQLATGIALAVVGAIMAIGAAVRPNVPPFSWFAARSAACWGERLKHIAVVVYGCLIIVFGIIVLAGVLPMRGSDE